MITYDDAIQLIQETTRRRKLATEEVCLTEAIGRVCAGNLLAGMDIQPFDNSAMDGFAVRLDDLASASSSLPVRLVKAGIIAAGQNTKGLCIEKGACWHIMTGAMLPEGADAIVPIENVTIENDAILFDEQPEAGQHIRHAGEDFKKGSVLLAAGDRITAAHILPLATLGISRVTVFQKEKVLFIPTGTEIVDDLSAPLAMGQIYNSNMFHAQAFLTACGTDVTIHAVIRDDLASFTKALAYAESEKYDIVISSGAVSAGSFDFVRDGLQQFGAEIAFHKVKLKPGKPNLLATLPSGALYFGLPGNPAATAVGLRFFVAEALRIIRQQKPETRVYARAMNSFSKKPGLHMVLKGRLEYWEDGSVTVDFLDGQESFKVSPFLNMNCWIHVSENIETIRSGDVVEAYPMHL